MVCFEDRLMLGVLAVDEDGEVCAIAPAVVRLLEVGVERMRKAHDGKQFNAITGDIQADVRLMDR
jgi:hypothetical protein